MSERFQPKPARRRTDATVDDFVTVVDDPNGGKRALIASSQMRPPAHSSMLDWLHFGHGKGKGRNPIEQDAVDEANRVV